MVNRILELIKEQGLTCTYVEKQLGFGNGAIKRFAKSSPSVDKIVKLSNFLNTSVEYIITGKQESYSLTQCGASPQERDRLLHLFNQLTPVNQGLILGRVEALLEQQNESYLTNQKLSHSQNSNPEKTDVHKQLA